MVSDPEVTPLRRTRRPPAPAPPPYPPRVTRQTSALVSRDSASPPPSTTTSPLAKHFSSEAPSQLLTDMEVMLSLDTELLTGPLQCGAQLLVGTSLPADEQDGVSSSEEEAGEQYYGLTRTVVSNEPFSPLLSTPPGRIEQLDGIHDGTDSEDTPQSRNGSLSGGKTPSHLPSEIVDFVLKSANVTNADHATQQQERVPSPLASTSPATQNGSAAVSLSNGKDCVSYQSSQGPPPLRDPPQVQRVCRPLLPITPNGPVNKPASKFLLVNKTTGQIIAVQDDSLDHMGQLGQFRQLQDGTNTDSHGVIKHPILRANRFAQKPTHKTQFACLPQTTAPVLSTTSSAPSQNIGTVFLQTTSSGSPAITLRVLPMLNMLHGTGQLNFGAPTMMAPTLSGIPQTCLLQGVPVNTGLLSVAPSPVQTQVPPQIQPPVQLPHIKPAPPKKQPIRQAPKRPCPVPNNISHRKKPKLDMLDKLEELDPDAIINPLAINCVSETVTTTRYGPKGVFLF